MEWTLTQIRHPLVASTISATVAPLLHHREVSFIDQRDGRWVGVFLSPLLSCRGPSSTMITYLFIAVKALGTLVILQIYLLMIE